ncbi:MAG TPA: heavy-metal-associated domain-containing protein [Gammaproteobacteria bacterium]|nr:heavy-metal-associated domain-containing protein [Gammaproteobacteria bacterium]
MKRILILLLPLIIWSTSAWSKEYQYEADVKGMVCAFCAYSVSKNINKLPGIVKESVDVSLKKGEVRFRSTSRVTQKTLESLFTKSGYTISGLTETEVKTASNTSRKATPTLELNFPGTDTDKFEPVIKAIGNIAAAAPSRLVIEAPQSLEMEILKPLLLGRQQVIKVEFVPVEQKSIRLRLFEEASKG